MTDLFTNKYEEAKSRWEQVKVQYDIAVELYEKAYLSLDKHHIALDRAWKEFSVQQSILLSKTKSPNIRPVKGKK
jgi:hypothetical protein